MGKRGPKPKRIVVEDWSSGLAYAVGLIATDGSLARTTPLVDLTSKDKEQLKNFNTALKTAFYIGTKRSGAGNMQYRIQIKNVYFYNFLMSVGIFPAKSKTIGPVLVPDRFFIDFLRGVFDGDGYSYSYFDKRWPSSFLLYAAFSSSGREFITWLRKKIDQQFSIHGHMTLTENGHYQLKYATKEAAVLLRKLYSPNKTPQLSRKRLKVSKALGMIGKRSI